jgi:hypothetical protein
MMTSRRAAALALAAALSACHPRTPPPDLSLDPAELLAQVKAAQQAVASVRGEVRVSMEAPGASGAAPALVAAQRPDAVYVQTLDFFGNAAAVLATAGGELSLYDARERVLYRGAATPENLARLVALPIPPEELATILCGSAPLLDGEPVRAEAGRGFVTLELAAGDRTQLLRVGPGAAVLRSLLRVRGRPAPGTYDLVFGASDSFGGRRFPREVTLSAEEPRVRLTVTWQDAEPNAALDPGLFAPPAPRGARVVDLAEAAPPAGLVPAPPPPSQ